MMITTKRTHRDVSSFILLCALLLLCNLVVAEEATNGELLFLKRCAICHELPKPEDITEEGWIEKMDMMAPLARLKKNQKQDVLQYLVSHSKSQVIASLQQKDQLLMEQKCSHCHTLDRVFEKMNGATQPDLFAHIVKQMQEKSPQWLSNEEASLISNYLDTLMKNGKLPESEN